jgi:hypothetical protein
MLTLVKILVMAIAAIAGVQLFQLEHIRNKRH